MDKISDFFHDIKDRATNPLISSFVIAWLLWNWKIPAGIVFLKPETLSKLGYGSMIDFIQHEISNGCRTIFGPLGSAVLYTGAIPFVKWGISVFYTWTRTRSNRSNLKIVGTGIIPGSLFIQIRDEYEKEIKEMSDKISTEAATLVQNKELSDKNQQLAQKLVAATQEIKTSTAKYTQLMMRFEYSNLDGIWYCYMTLPNHIKVFRHYRFVKDEIFFLENDEMTKVGNIKGYCINLIKSAVSLVTTSIEGNVSYYFLNYNDDFSEMEGYDLEGSTYRYSRRRIQDLDNHMLESNANQEIASLNFDAEDV
ncbi:hypothetical protein ACTJJB_23710 [Chitinophaga sp. 22536]|uniref:hypothetical protein n=1 Tax=unclassified Chitinophaga TaxID=2619133 RepID=UPI003F85C538